MNHSSQTSPSHHEISLQLLTTDQKDDVQEEHEWLSDQFNRIPYILYKLWLLLTFITTLSIQPTLILSQWKNPPVLHRFGLACLTTSSMLVLLGCGEMLFAMVKRKSAFAQKGLIKFQYSFIGTILGIMTLIEGGFEFNGSFLFGISILAALPVSTLVNLIGCFAVLGAFKKNHPLERLQGSQDMNPDFMEQNEVIASELLKFDKELDRWPYKVYKFWLKFVLVNEIIVISVCIFFGIPKAWSSQEIAVLATYFPLFLICSSAAFCCYEMEVVLKTKKLEKSKKALFHLKICIFVTTIVSANEAGLSEKAFTLEDFFGVGIFVLIPLITLIGAWRINKIIEQRDQFAKVSSFSGDHYL